MKLKYYHASVVQTIYFIIYLALSSVIIFTPILIKGSVYITKSFIIDEEIAEVILLAILFSLNIMIFKLYKREASRQEEFIKKINNDKKTTEEKLYDSLSYIGKVNVQIEEIKTIFNTANTYPETKNEFKKTFRFLSERVLGIVNTNWALLRIINSNTQRTISECFETRHGFSCPYPHISNKMIIEKQLIPSCTTVISNSKNLNILVYCTMPIDQINNDQQIFIQAIINEIIMLFIILNSSYYKNGNNVDEENNSHDKGKKIYPITAFG
ncbi:MAG: hypothetical protein NTX44_11720 [Ignavibacteriales bacterium]|nr:hypothetical protein [Ignavibacteriales bacterium]